MIKIYLQDEAGNMTMTFAVSVVMLMVGVGAAIDLNTLSSNKADLQRYADAAVLAAVVSGEDDIEVLNQIAVKTVNANNFSGETLDTTLSILDNDSYRVSVTASHDLILMDMFGVGDPNVIVIAEAPPLGASAKLNLALVLDVTLSMDGSKLDALKLSANGLVDSISDDDGGETMFSVVPFAQYVKIPRSYDGETWLEVEPPYLATWELFDEDASTGCVTTGSGEDEEIVCDVTVMEERTAWVQWDGCMGSRNFPWHDRVEYGTSKLQGFAGGGECHSEMLPLTSDTAAVKSTINALSADQDTYIPAGLMWGWRSLTPGVPLTQANTADYAERKNVMVLMTDGENKKSIFGTQTTFNGRYHWGDDVAGTNTLTSDICTDIKADDIIIYTIAFDITDADTLALLENCATTSTHFFGAEDTDALQTAFSDIGNALEGEVRLTK